MVKISIIAKLKEVNLLGRSGGHYPAYLKWQTVIDQESPRKFIVCNGAEGEPGMKKDGFILKNFPREVIGGIKVALREIKGSTAYLYLNSDYYEKFGPILEKLIGQDSIRLFKKPPGYMAGDEMTIMNIIEKGEIEPRAKPPFPTEKGLWGCPTLVNNVETFYYVYLVDQGEYTPDRFYTLGGDLPHPGVYRLPLDFSPAKILRETDNYPDFDFFAHLGGGICGSIFLPEELEKPIDCAHTILIYDRKKTNLWELMHQWSQFLLKNNCDKCVPCREGVYRINEMIENRRLEIVRLRELFFVLRETSFCSLGKGVPNGFESLIEKLKLNENPTE